MYIRHGLMCSSCWLKREKATHVAAARLCRERSREVTMLRAALAERDSRLRSAKAELMAAHAALKDKDAELQVRPDSPPFLQSDAAGMHS